MANKTIRLLSFLLALVITAGVFFAVPLTAGATEEETPYFDHGTCGASAAENVQWFTFNDGSIAILGDGAIASYLPDGSANPTAPWYTSGYLMATLTSTKVAVEDGVTAIGDYDFYLPSAYLIVNQMVSVDLPESLISIGAHAFENQSKLQKITIPLNVSSIGADAFAGCAQLRHIDFYCDPTPTALEWADDSRPFTTQVTCHINPRYEDKVDELNRTYKAKNVNFEANLYNGLINESDGVERNIKAYMAQETTSILGGAVPVVVIGTFSGQKKSVTHGSNGFATCVRLGTEGNYRYYVHTNNSSGNINEVTLNPTSGIVTAVSDTPHDTLRLTVRIEYIGASIVKIIYEIQNIGESPVDNVMLGGTGDIKIGADDYAAISPLTEDESQVGFYMTSRKAYDQSGSDYATLGFIGQGVKLNSTDDEPLPAATYFYGPVAGNKGQSATGVYKHRLMPERVFTPGTGAQISGAYNTDNKGDAGMSYYWDVGTVAAEETKKYAVLFSVYGNDTTQADSGQSMVTEKSKTYYTVTWNGHNGTALLKQAVESGTAPVYDGETPVKPSDDSYHYEFKGWSSDGGTTVLSPGELPVVDGDVTYTAQFEPKPKFFAKHSLTLDDGDIGVNFYIDPRGAGLTAEDVTEGTKTITIQFSWYNKTGTYKISAEDLNTKDGTDYFKATCRVAAAEMAYNIHAVAFISDSPSVLGAEYTKEHDNYSVMQYGKTIITASENTFDHQEALVALARTMLDYGAKAQVVFDRQQDIDGSAVPLANDFSVYPGSSFGYTMAAHTIAGSVPDVEAPEDSGLRFYGVSMIFLSKTTIRLYYRVTDRAAFEELSNRSDFKQNGSLYYLETAGIRADRLDDDNSFRIGDTAYTYSGLDYAGRLQGRPSSHEQNLGTAIYWYSTAANAYFASVGEGA